ncbi:hypothetical protein E2542_SST24965 [Spatholobus suberectus]|nr:hypothetical protein E2542_SST24965 [Spatholobus suberectus]
MCFECDYFACLGMLQENMLPACNYIVLGFELKKSKQLSCCFCLMKLHYHITGPKFVRYMQMHVHLIAFSCEVFVYPVAITADASSGDHDGSNETPTSTLR